MRCGPLSELSRLASGGNAVSLPPGGLCAPCTVGNPSLTNPLKSLLLPVLGSVFFDKVVDRESMTGGTGLFGLSAIRLDLRGDILFTISTKPRGHASNSTNFAGGFVTPFLDFSGGTVFFICCGGTIVSVAGIISPSSRSPLSPCPPLDKVWPSSEC